MALEHKVTVHEFDGVNFTPTTEFAAGLWEAVTMIHTHKVLPNDKRQVLILWKKTVI